MRGTTSSRRAVLGFGPHGGGDVGEVELLARQVKARTPTHEQGH
jgi:hypothetical protein